MGMSPEAISALNSAAGKWRSIAATTGLGPDVLNPLMEADWRRIQAGSQPLPHAESLIGAAAASRVGFQGGVAGQGTITGNEIFPAPRQGFLGDVRSDLGSLARGLLHLPTDFFHEGEKIVSEGPQDISKALDAGSFSKTIAGLAQAPGLRMIPGSFVVGSIAHWTQGLRQLEHHPVFTAMDLLPFVSEGAQALRPDLAEAAHGAIPAWINEVGDKAWGKAAQRFPGLAMHSPAQMLENIGLGDRNRTVASIVGGELTREAQKELLPYVNHWHDTLEGHGLSAQEKLDVLSTAQAGEGDWRKTLNERQNAWLDDVVRFRDEVASLGEKARPGWLLHWNVKVGDELRDEVFSTRDPRNSREEAFIKTAQRHYRITRKIALRLKGDEPLAAKVRDWETRNWRWVEGERQRIGNEDHPLTPHQKARLSRTPALLAKWRSQAEEAKALADAKVAGVPPARYSAGLTKILKDRFSEHLSALVPPDELAKALDRAFNLGGSDLVAPELIDAWTKEIITNWQDLAHRYNLNPEWIHHVDERGFNSIMSNRLFPEQPPRETTSQGRAFLDMTPYIPDAEIALTHQLWEQILRPKYEELAQAKLRDEYHYIRPTQVVRDELYDLAAQGAGKGITVADRLDDLMRKHYVIWDTKTGRYQFAQAHAGVFKGELIPKALAETMQKMHRPVGGLRAIQDPVLGAFRTSVLTYNPTYYLHISFADAFLATLRSGPSLFSPEHVSQALNWIRHPEQMPAVIAKDGPMFDHDMTKVWQLAGGRTMGRFMRDVFSGKEADLATRLTEARTSGGGLTRKLENFTDNVHTMYRSLAYLYGQDKALTKGMSTEAAASAGARAANTFFQNWDRTVPLERQVFRYVVPFYSWSYYLLRYLSTYPFDHPLRASIISNFARNELNDWGTGLPQRFGSMFFFGHPDAMGNIKAINAAGVDPFLTISNLFTISGFISHLNPVLKASLAAIPGMSKFGVADLHPETTYDPNTGKLVPVSGSSLSQVAGAFIPQLGAGLEILNQGQDLKRLAMTNPDAFKRLLLGDLGLRFVPTTYNLRSEAASAERARYEAYRQAVSLALKGDPSLARQYPSLGPLVRQIASQQASQQSSTPLQILESLLG